MCELCTDELSMCEFVPSAGEFDPGRGEVVIAKKPCRDLLGAGLMSGAAF